MTPDNFDTLLSSLKGAFDTESPSENHEKRFLKKLNAHNRDHNTRSKRYWTQPFAIAASSIIVIGLALSFLLLNPKEGLNAVSYEMAETQSYFKTAVTIELEKLKRETNPAFKQIIEDTIEQLTLLESDYDKLEQELKTNENSERIIAAMIANFKNRIELLDAVLQQIDFTKTQNQHLNETANTI